jgi:hypothetical protein
MKLHGFDVQVGDTVHHIIHGEGIVRPNGLPSDATDAILVEFASLIPGDFVLFGRNGHEIVDCVSYGPQVLFWQAISPAALAAARTKPTPPEYEWQWIVQRADGTCYLSPHATERKGFPYEQDAKVLGKLEISQREVVPPAPKAEWKVKSTVGIVHGGADYWAANSRGNQYLCDDYEKAQKLCDRLNAAAALGI